MIQKPVEWLWPNRLAIGKLALIGGDPGMGKSQIATDIEARITRAGSWPDGGRTPTGSVVILASEDSPEDTIVPRLDIAGADLRRVRIIRATIGQGGKRTFSLQSDLDKLAEVIQSMGDVAFVRFDPITSYMGSDIDSHRTTDVRSVLEPVASFADRMKVAIFAITHPPKASQAKAILSFTGSLAYVAAARLAFVAMEEPETDRKLFLSVKNNVGPKAEGLGYRLVQGVNSKGILISHIIWDPEPVTLSADEAMQAAASESRRGRAQREATDFLREMLSAGPVPAEQGLAAAKAVGIASKTLERARKVLGVIAEKGDFNGGWVWRLP